MKKTSKLGLAKETVRALDTLTMTDVVGGMVYHVSAAATFCRHSIAANATTCRHSAAATFCHTTL